MDSVTYTDKDRRQHRMFVTRNTEYHFRDRICVAVRDRHSGSWLLAHLALKRKLSGGIRFKAGGALPSAGEPLVGEALYFGSDGRELVTSLLCAIERPAKAVVTEYAALGA